MFFYMCKLRTASTNADNTQGNFRGAKRHGQGTLVSQSGTKCVKSPPLHPVATAHCHHDDTLEPCELARLHQSSRYVGGWVEDVKQGQGVLTFASG